ncbi:hypothetical protein KS527_004458 [Salmonella enterica]|nr:hypothetical protein [Salmonella enterica]EHQ9605701.1 hypothetical protein [Salmonella enterica]
MKNVIIALTLLFSAFSAFAGDHGSEFEERGDIARPEYAGAHTFTGHLYIDDRMIGYVTLERKANGDIIMTTEDGNISVWKLDPDITGKAGTYNEPRLTTEFEMGNGSMTVLHTKIVK